MTDLVLPDIDGAPLVVKFRAGGSGTDRQAAAPRQGSRIDLGGR